MGFAHYKCCIIIIIIIIIIINSIALFEARSMGLRSSGCYANIPKKYSSHVCHIAFCSQMVLIRMNVKCFDHGSSATIIARLFSNNELKR